MKLGFLLALSLLGTGCVSLRRYRRDVDAAEMHGEAKVLGECVVYAGSNFDRDDTLYLLNSEMDVFKLRKINRDLGIYEYPTNEETK